MAPRGVLAVALVASLAEQLRAAPPLRSHAREVLRLTEKSNCFSISGRQAPVASVASAAESWRRAEVSEGPIGEHWLCRLNLGPYDLCRPCSFPPRYRVPHDTPSTAQVPYLGCVGYPGWRRKTHVPRRRTCRAFSGRAEAMRGRGTGGERAEVSERSERSGRGERFSGRSSGRLPSSRR